MKFKNEMDDIYQADVTIIIIFVYKYMVKGIFIVQINVKYTFAKPLICKCKKEFEDWNTVLRLESTKNQTTLYSTWRRHTKNYVI